MRKQIAAANWKMNLSLEQGEKLLDDILEANLTLSSGQQAIFAVPFPYLISAAGKIGQRAGYAIAAQNCNDKKSGAYTGEVSAEMLRSIGIRYCVIGHSERREYFFETNKLLADKVNICLQNGITPIFCCGEPLRIREENNQDQFVQQQLEESLFHLSPEQVRTLIIAYEPIWAIGTGKTASTEQAQEMHAHLRSVLAGKYGQEVAGAIPILYGGSVKAGNARELFNSPDVDGGLVGGASLIANEFIEIIKALKK
jgi:triosephosphate isomerase (TIM)